MHAGTEEQTEGTISLLPIEQLPWLTQINLTWLLRCRKKIPNKLQHCWKLAACTIHALLGNLQHPDIATAWVPSLQREVNTHWREKEYFSFSQLWLGHDAKQQLSYFTQQESSPHHFEKPLHEHMLTHSASLPPFWPLPESGNYAIPPFYSEASKAMRGIAQTAFWNVVGAAVALGFLQHC